MTRAPHMQILGAQSIGLLAVGLFSACGGKGDDLTPARDAGAGSSQDATVQDCSSNPRGCIAHAAMQAAPSCECITNARGEPVCETGYTYNATSRSCAASGAADAGPRNDAGPGTDGGADAGADAGSADGGDDTCAANADCPGGAKASCVSTASLQACNGLCSDGVCGLTCDWTQGPVGECGAGQDCVWLGPDADPASMCFADQGGVNAGQPCTATFDAQGEQTGDDCNRSKNYFCIGATQAAPTGECAAVCSPSNSTYCGTVAAGLSCARQGSGFGLCLPIPTWTDTGKACTTSATCQGSASRICEKIASSGSCSSACSETAYCPGDSACVQVTGQAPFCLLDCTEDASVCAQRNAGFTCQTVTANLKVCAEP